jgi:hypothetical protein
VNDQADDRHFHREWATVRIGERKNDELHEEVDDGAIQNSGDDEMLDGKRLKAGDPNESGGGQERDGVVTN